MQIKYGFLALLYFTYRYRVALEIWKGHRQVVGCWIVKGAMDRSTVVGRRDHAAMATPATSAQVANAWRRAE
jgi:hypothetical protein